MLKRLLFAVLLLCACAAQAAVYSLPWGPKPQFVDQNGAPMVSGTLSTYVAGSSTPQVTYTDSTGGVANPTSITLNVRGETPNEVWLTGGKTYKFVLKDSSGSTVWTIDNVAGVNDTSASAVTEWIAGPAPTYVSATSFTLAGDQTVAFHIGRRTRTTNSGGTVYSTITASSFAVNTTTITVVNDAATSLDSGLSAVSYGILARANASVPAFRTGDPGTALTGTTPRQVPDKLSDFVNGKDFGAKCDGTTNDTAAIQAALDSLKNTGTRKGGTVRLPNGNCYLATPLILDTRHESITLEGEARGRGATTVTASQLSALTTAIKTATTGTFRPGIDGTLYGVTLKNLLVQGSSGAHSHLVMLNGVYTLRLEGLYLSGTNASSDNLQLSNAVDVNVVDLVCAGAGRYCVNMGNPTGTGNASTTIRFRGGYLANAQQAAIHAVGAGQMSHFSVDGTIFESNGRGGSNAHVASAAGVGIQIDNAEDVNIRGYFEGNYYADVVLGGSVDGAGTITKGSLVKRANIDMWAYAIASPDATPARDGLVMVYAEHVEANGYFSAHSHAELLINATSAGDVADVFFNRLSFGSVPSSYVGDAGFNRISVSGNPSGMVFGGSLYGNPSAAAGTGILAAELSGDGLRMPGNTGTSGMKTGNGYMFYNYSTSMPTLYSQDAYYPEQNPRGITYAIDAQPATIPQGYGKYVLRVNTPANVALPAGQVNYEVLDIMNTGTGAATITGFQGGGTVVLNTGNAVRVMYGATLNVWAAFR